MRLQTILVLFLLILAMPSLLNAKTAKKSKPAVATAAAPVETAVPAPTVVVASKEPYNGKLAGKTGPGQYELNEAIVDKIDGTVMVQRANGVKPFALETDSTVEKGDILTVYDKSWVVLKDHKGDRIGLDSGTSAVVDEFYIQGPDRQIRLVLQKGSLLLKISGCGSRQSFFEINSGSVVTAINDSQCVLGYDSAKDAFKVQYFWGKLTVIDKDSEQKLKEEYTEHNWDKGKMVAEELVPVDELDRENFHRFFNAESRLVPQDNNLLLRGNE